MVKNNILIFNLIARQNCIDLFILKFLIDLKLIAFTIYFNLKINHN